MRGPLPGPLARAAASEQRTSKTAGPLQAAPRRIRLLSICLLIIINLLFINLLFVPSPGRIAERGSLRVGLLFRLCSEPPAPHSRASGPERKKKLGAGAARHARQAVHPSEREREGECPREGGRARATAADARRPTAPAKTRPSRHPSRRAARRRSGSGDGARNPETRRPGKPPASGLMSPSRS